MLVRKLEEAASGGRELLQRNDCTEALQQLTRAVPLKVLLTHSVGSLHAATDKQHLSASHCSNRSAMLWRHLSATLSSALGCSAPGPVAVAMGNVLMAFLTSSTSIVGSTGQP